MPLHYNCITDLRKLKPRPRSQKGGLEGNQIVIYWGDITEQGEGLTQVRSQEGGRSNRYMAMASLAAITEYPANS